MKVAAFILFRPILLSSEPETESAAETSELEQSEWSSSMAVALGTARARCLSELTFSSITFELAQLFPGSPAVEALRT